MNNNRIYFLMFLLLSIVIQPYAQSSSQVLNVGQPVNPIIGSMSTSFPGMESNQKASSVGKKKKQDRSSKCRTTCQPALWCCQQTHRLAPSHHYLLPLW